MNPDSVWQLQRNYITFLDLLDASTGEAVQCPEIARHFHDLMTCIPRGVDNSEPIFCLTRWKLIRCHTYISKLYQGVTSSDVVSRSKADAFKDA